jgi:hypothetical protein
VSIRRIEGTFGSFADSDANFQFYDDGRLKSINQSTTGQGETIIKSVVSLGTTVAGAGFFSELSEGEIPGKGGAKPPAPNEPPPLAICKVIQDWGGQQSSQGDKGAQPGQQKGPASVSLTYTAELNAPNKKPIDYSKHTKWLEAWRQKARLTEQQT